MYDYSMKNSICIARLMLINVVLHIRNVAWEQFHMIAERLETKAICQSKYMNESTFCLEIKTFMSYDLYFDWFIGQVCVLFSPVGRAIFIKTNMREDLFLNKGSLVYLTNIAKILYIHSLSSKNLYF